jgi:phospholipid N-methyltransferase
MKFFVVEALKNFKTSGTITPSSKHLVRTCLKKINWQQTGFILELGTGNGCITDEILHHGRKDLRLISLEINEVFFQYTKDKYQDDKRLIMLNESAFDMRAIIEKHGDKKPDIILSSLPLTLFKEEEIDQIVRTIYENLDEHGVYIQYQYSPVTLKYIKRYFPRVKYELVIRNIPPAIVYRAYKKHV